MSYQNDCRDCVWLGWACRKHVEPGASSTVLQNSECLICGTKPDVMVGYLTVESATSWARRHATESGHLTVVDSRVSYGGVS